MPLKLNSSGGGSVTLDVPATGSTFALNLPAQNGSVVAANASGDVGIGVASPGAKLQVVGSTTVAGYSNVAAAFGSGVTSELYVGSLNGNAPFIASGGANPLLFQTNGSERARIDSVGNFLVGRTNVSFGASTGAWIDPVGALVLERDSEATLFLARVGGNSNGAVANFFWGSGRAYVGNIAVQSTGTSYNSISDYRLKENVVPLTGAAARVQALKPSRFNFIADPDRTVDGFIAHEAAEVVPEAVIGEKDAVDEDGSIQPQSIDQSKLVPLLTAALQEALSRIETLEARLAAVETR